MKALTKKEMTKVLELITEGYINDIEIRHFGHVTCLEIAKGFGIDQNIIDKIYVVFKAMGYRIIELDTEGYWRFNINYKSV